MKLYQEHLTNIKPTSNGWYIASCPNPNHPDTNPSFSFHREGNSKCLGNCNWGGTEYDVAMLMNLPNAKEYLRDESGNYIDISKQSPFFQLKTLVGLGIYCGY